MTDSQTYPRFLNNSPRGEDLLKNGSQKRVATNIAAHIKDNAAGFRLIGLDGSWGSGKSNVISIIKEELKKTHHLFIYDAWSHQEDLQRRSFLEELTSDLQEQGLIDAVQWKGKLQTLLAKKKQTTTRTVPQLSYAIICTLVLAAISPITKTVSDQIDGTIWKILIAASPVVVALLLWGVAAVKDRKFLNLINLFYIYKEKELETTSTEMVSENEPSVAEFRSWMLDLSLALGKNVIVVVDNMDRLPVEKVKSVWSMIHTFFSEKTYDQIYVVVPFDRNHIVEAFDNKSEDADQFINKTFSVIFRVSPIVLTDWWGLFENYYKEAFGDKQQTEYEWVRNIFDRHQTVITPRSIIAFINELVSLKMIWNDQIPLRYMALYVLNKSAILPDPTTQILSGDYLKKVNLLFQDDSDLPDYISALVYNVPVSEASQVALHREILLTIRDSNFYKLVELAKHPSFYTVLDEVSLREEIDLQPWTIAMDRLGDTEDNKKDERGKSTLPQIWNRICNKRLSTPIDVLIFTSVDERLLRGIPVLRRKSVVKYFLDQFYIARDFKSAAYFKALDAIDEVLATEQMEVDIPSLIKTKELPPESFLEYVRAAGEEFAKFKVVCDNTALDLHLQSSVFSDFTQVKLISCLIGTYTFPKVKAALEDAIISGNIQPNGLAILFTLYKLLSDNKPLFRKLPDKKIAELFPETTEEAWHELLAMRLARGGSFSGNDDDFSPEFRSSSDAGIERVAERIEWYIDYSDLLALASQWKNVLLSAVVKRLLQMSKENRVIRLKEVFPLIADISRNIGMPVAALFDNFSESGIQLEGLLTVDDLEEVIPEFTTFEVAFASSNKLAILIKTTVNAYLDSIDKKTWTELLDDGDAYALTLLKMTLAKEVIKTLPAKALEAFKQLLSTLAESEEWKPENEEAWSLFYDKSDKRALVFTIKNIRDQFLNNINITTEKFHFFEQMLRRQGSLTDRPGDTVRRILAPVQDDDDCLAIITDSREFYADLIKKAGDEALDYVRFLGGKHEEDRENENLALLWKDIERLIPDDTNNTQ